jgi:hypothetical protein
VNQVSGKTKDNAELDQIVIETAVKIDLDGHRRQIVTARCRSS